MQVYIHMCVCKWRLEVSMECLPLITLHLFKDRVSDSQETPIWLVWLARKLQESTWIYPAPKLGWLAHANPAFCVGSEDFNSGLHACMVGISATESFSATVPSLRFLTIINIYEYKKNIQSSLLTNSHSLNLLVMLAKPYVLVALFAI